jgi:hypothetical protein
MKLKRMCLIVGVLVLSLLSAPAASPSQPVHSVTGSGLVDMRNDPDFLIDVVFRTTVAAHQDAQGNAWGSVVVNIFRLFDTSVPFTIHGQVYCVDVEADGKTAWVYARITQSGNTELYPVGGNLVTYVRDVGGAGEDFMHEELAANVGPIDCGDRPDILRDITRVDGGNYNVR